ncbi:MAG TPA: phosphatase PAP2 family protein [Pirellulales bacterium]|jgi:membrane-associated phospholipid phosphatase|nr:phosphatase PAP2 family protein [Pirellulales bacterium]
MLRRIAIGLLFGAAAFWGTRLTVRAQAPPVIPWGELAPAAPQATAPAAMTPPAMMPAATPQVLGNAIRVPTADPFSLWQQIVETLSQYYPVERNSPPRLLGGQWEQGRLQTFALVLPTPPAISAPVERRWIGVAMQPAATGGCQIEVSAFVEAQDALRGVDPEAGTWRSLGRDEAEEQRIVAALMPRIGGGASVFDPRPALVDDETTHSTGYFSRWPRVEHEFDNIVSDYKNYYSCRSLIGQGIAFAIAAPIANTEADQDLRSAYNHGIGYQSGIHAFKVFGEGLYTFPAFAAIYLVGTVFEDRPVGGLFAEYGGRGLRAGIVGGPALLLMQEVTGAGRPDEHPWGSNWKFFVDDNGVSGHAFVGAIPFITAAKMTERPVLKVVFYGLSVMPGLSRVNDQAHYPSQVFLGYTMALFACTAVDNTQTGRAPRILPWASGNATGLGMEWRH